MQQRSILHKFGQSFRCCKQNKIMATTKKFHRTNPNKLITSQEWQLPFLCLASCMSATSQSQHLFCFVSKHLLVLIYYLYCIILSLDWICCVFFSFVSVQHWHEFRLLLQCQKNCNVSIYNASKLSWYWNIASVP